MDRAQERSCQWNPLIRPADRAKFNRDLTREGDSGAGRSADTEEMFRVMQWLQEEQEQEKAKTTEEYKIKSHHTVENTLGNPKTTHVTGTRLYRHCHPSVTHVRCTYPSVDYHGEGLETHAR